MNKKLRKKGEDLCDMRIMRREKNKSEIKRQVTSNKYE
jgi:hypothetical protein